MNRTDLIADVAKRTGMTKKDAEKIVLATFDAITEELIEGNRVSISGFGVFTVRDVAGRECRNPNTGEIVYTESSRKPVFAASDSMKTKFR